MSTSPPEIRRLRATEYLAAADVICSALRDWSAAHGRPGRFPGGAPSALIFPEVYESLDPGCCSVVDDPATGRIAGVCFYHPRELHISIGIVAVHPDFFGRGIAKKMIDFACVFADRERKSLRLVSSAANLDSYSVYTRFGFVARVCYPTMTLSVPATGIQGAAPAIVRKATLADVPAMVALEEEVSGIRRPKDFEYFIANALGVWNTSVLEIDSRLEGVLVSIRHPNSEMLGPGLMRTEDAARTLITHHLDAHHRGGSPTFLIPATSPDLLQAMYKLGARTNEIHLLQTRGNFQPLRGVSMPTFMPETA